MFTYKFHFAKYKMRAYEKYLAIKEIENQFTCYDEINIYEKYVELFTSNKLNENTIKRLAFFSSYNEQIGDSNKSSLTNQVIVENYLDYLPDLFKDIKISNKRNIRYLTHSFHEYKGRFYPQLVKSLMNYAGAQPNYLVVDPFCGSGTTLVECSLYGTNSIGLDINPIAILLAKAKVRSLLFDRHDLNSLHNFFKNFENNVNWKNTSLKNYHDKLDVDYLQRWFPIENLKKVFAIIEFVEKLENEDYKLFSKVILSNLLKEYSFQDPSQLRIRVRKDIPPQNLIGAFEKSIIQQIASLNLFQSHKNFNISSNVIPILGDIKSLMENTNLAPNSVDLVITSPPYATALPYIDTDRLSLFVFGFTNRSNFKELEKSVIGNREITKSSKRSLELGLEKNFENPTLPNEIIELLKKIYFLNKNSDVGFRRKNTAALLFKYFVEMDIGISQVSEVLKKNHFAFFVVGNNRTKAGDENISIPTDDFIGLIGENNDLILLEKIKLSVQKPYLIHSKNSISSESILVFKKR